MNVNIRPFGLGDVAGSQDIYLAEHAAGSNSLVGIGDEFAHGARETIEMMTGADWSLCSAGDPDLIKVDIEGFEPNFFRGAREVIDRNRPTLLLELNRTYVLADDEASLAWQELLSWLFGLYARAVLFDVDGVREVQAFDVSSLACAPRPISIGFTQKRDV